MKFIPLPKTVFVAKVHESTKKSRMSCQQRNVISKRSCKEESNGETFWTLLKAIKER